QGFHVVGRGRIPDRGCAPVPAPGDPILARGWDWSRWLRAAGSWRGPPVRHADVSGAGRAECPRPTSRQSTPPSPQTRVVTGEVAALRCWSNDGASGTPKKDPASVILRRLNQIGLLRARFFRSLSVAVCFCSIAGCDFFG